MRQKLEMMISVNALVVPARAGSRSEPKMQSRGNAWFQATEQLQLIEVAVRAWGGVLTQLSLAIFLLGNSAFAQTPQITGVTFSGSAGNYTVSINGSGFGSPAASIPYTGDVSNFRLGDSAELMEWGYTGDADFLTYSAWSDTNITVSGFGGQPGDAITIALWNATSQIGATWGGNVPTSASIPQITSVQLSSNGATLSIVVNGSGFGTAPPTLPVSGSPGNINYFRFIDFRAHCGASSSLFEAGFEGWGINAPDTVTLNFESWSNTQIIISGFAGSYGSSCATYEAGDPVVIVVFSTSDTSNTGPQTAWGGAEAMSSTSTFSLSASPTTQLLALSGSVCFPITVNNLSAQQLSVALSALPATSSLSVEFSGNPNCYPLVNAQIGSDVVSVAADSSTVVGLIVTAQLNAPTTAPISINVSGVVNAITIPLMLGVTVEKTVSVQNIVDFTSLGADSEVTCPLWTTFSKFPTTECFSIQQNFFIYAAGASAEQCPVYWAQNIILLTNAVTQQYPGGIWEALPVFQVSPVTNCAPINFALGSSSGFGIGIWNYSSDGWIPLGNPSSESSIPLTLRSTISENSTATGDAVTFATTIGNNVNTFDCDPTVLSDCLLLKVPPLPLGSYISAGQASTPHPSTEPFYEPQLAFVSMPIPFLANSTAVVNFSPSAPGSPVISGKLKSSVMLTGQSFQPAYGAPMSVNCAMTNEESSGLLWSLDGSTFDNSTQPAKGEGIAFVPGTGMTCH